MKFRYSITRALLGLFSAFCLLPSAFGQNTIISATITVTNIVNLTNASGYATLAVRGQTYTWTTNATADLAAGELAGTNNVNRAATNLFTTLAADYTNRLIVTYAATNAVKLQAFQNAALAVSLSTNTPLWGSLVLVTSTPTPASANASNVMATKITLNGTPITNWNDISGSGTATNLTGNATNQVNAQIDARLTLSNLVSEVEFAASNAAIQLQLAQKLATNGNGSGLTGITASQITGLPTTNTLASTSHVAAVTANLTPANWLVWNDASQYYALNRATAATTTNASFSALLQYIADNSAGATRIELAAIHRTLPSTFYRFYLTNTVTFANSVIISGQGNPASIISAVASSQTPLIKFDGVGGIVRLENIRFEDGGNDNVVAVEFANTAEPNIFGCEFYGFTNAVQISGNAFWTQIIKTWFVTKLHSVSGESVVLRSPSNLSTGPAEAFFSDCEFWNFGTGIRAKDGYSNIRISNSRFLNASGSTSAGITNAILIGAGSSNVIISGNHFLGGWTNHPVKFADASPVNATVFGNVSDGYAVSALGDRFVGVVDASGGFKSNGVFIAAGGGSPGLTNGQDAYLGSLVISNVSSSLLSSNQLIARYMGNGDVTDSHTNGLNGTNNGAQFVTGLAGQAFRLVGTNNVWLPIPGAKLCLSNDFTVSAWVRLTNDSVGGWVFSSGAPGAGDTITVFDRGDTAGYFAFYDGSSVYEGVTDLRDNSWHHCLVTRSNAALTIWVDGTHEATHTVTVNASLANFVPRIGFSGYGDAVHKIDIDDLTIWRVGMGADAIGTLYSIGAEANIPTTNFFVNLEAISLTATQATFSVPVVGIPANTNFDTLNASNGVNVIDGKITIGNPITFPAESGLAQRALRIFNDSNSHVTIASVATENWINEFYWELQDGSGNREAAGTIGLDADRSFFMSHNNLADGEVVFRWVDNQSSYPHANLAASTNGNWWITGTYNGNGHGLVFTNASGSKFTLGVNSTTNGFVFVPVP